MRALNGVLAKFREIAKRQPSAPAVAWRSTTWTYSELDEGIELVSCRLRALGLEDGSRVALLLRNSPQYVAAYYGTLAADCVAVPLNAQERAPTLSRQIQHCEADVLIGDAHHPEWANLQRTAHDCSVGHIGLTLGHEESATAILDRDLRAAVPPGMPRHDRTKAPEELASIIYTSGTTGSPKGVMLSERNLSANAEAIIASLNLTERDRSLCVLPFHFSYGNSILHSHLLCGAALVLEDSLAFPHLLLKRMQDEHVTGFAGVPSTFALLLSRCDFTDFDLASLRYVTQAGGPMPAGLLSKLRESLPSASIFLMYGQTEATARLTCLPAHELDEKAGSVGRPIDGVALETRSEAGEPLPPGEVGEVFARGPGVMMGYWNNAEATAQVMRGEWLNTHDLGYLDEDGYLHIVGRTSDLIKVGAFRVSPQEIEETILSLDGIEEVAVVGIPDEILGEAAKAVVVARPRATLTAMEVKHHCRENLASYKVPKVVEFADELPRTSSGKIQRFKLQ